MPNKIELASDEKCTGCMACLNICHKNAIHTIQNRQGFYRPQIDLSRCVYCGLCENVCPQKNNLRYACTNQTYYAFKNKDEIRRRSSSGGVFTWISDVVLDQNGIIIGVIMDENLKAVHISADDEKVRNLMRGSKYVQSEIGYIYRIVKQYLDKGRKVFFTGTPCQCEGLLVFLGEKQDKTNLLTLDFICEGGASPLIFNDFISYYEKKKGIKIRYANFRDKDHVKYGATVFGRRLVVSEYLSPNGNGDYVYDRKINDRFHDNMFLGVLQQEACMKCKFHSYDHCTDFTCGDFHRYRKGDGFNDELGISELLVNSEKAQKFLKDHGNEVILHECTREDVWQPLLEQDMQNSLYRRLFWHLYKEYGFEKASGLILIHIYKIKLVRKIARVKNKLK
jgi:NAD-dependent dihydropyrimidine dehydrogenase PreA subunit